MGSYVLYGVVACFGSAAVLLAMVWYGGRGMRRSDQDKPGRCTDADLRAFFSAAHDDDGLIRSSVPMPIHRGRKERQ